MAILLFFCDYISWIYNCFYIKFNHYTYLYIMFLSLITDKYIKKHWLGKNMRTNRFFQDLLQFLSLFIKVFDCLNPAVWSLNSRGQRFRGFIPLTITIVNFLCITITSIGYTLYYHTNIVMYSVNYICIYVYISW